MIGKYQRMISANPDLANQTPRLSLMVRLLVNSGTGGGGATKKIPGRAAICEIQECAPDLCRR